MQVRQSSSIYSCGRQTDALNSDSVTINFNKAVSDVAREKVPDTLTTARERMGKLVFARLEVTALSNEAALVLGRWHLEREPEPIGGNFSLVFRRIDDRWLIVHDHTSVAE